MKNILFLACILFVIISCTEDKSTINKSHARLSNISYHDQYSYVKSIDQDDMMNFEIDKDLIAKTEDSIVAWTYFDSLYVNTLPADIQVDLAYRILVKKDLIGLVEANPTNTTYKDALMKYVDVLVANEYIGYTTLYYALYAIKDSEASYVSGKAGAISDYSKDDEFHPMIIADTSGDPDTVDKFTANWEMVEEIEALE